VKGMTEHVPSDAKGQPHPGEHYRAGGGYHHGARWMPGGGAWGAGGHYEGGTPHLVTPAGVAIAGQHRGKRIARQKGRTKAQELDARAAQHSRRMEDNAYRADYEREAASYGQDARADYEREAASYGQDARADFRRWVKEQGGIRPDRKRAVGDKYDPRKRDEYATLPQFAKNSKSGTTLDDMAMRAGESFPGLGIETESDLAAYLHTMDTGSSGRGGGRRYRPERVKARAAPALSAQEFHALAYQGGNDEYAF